MSRLSLLRTSDYRRVRWKNDGGWTTEIARDPADESADFRWRVSIAEIETDGPFSTFPAIDRDLILLSGAGMDLEFADALPVRISERFQHVHFRGESDVRCRLMAGPTRDFNVMVRRGTARAEVVARPLVGSMVIFPEPDAEWLIHVHAGHAVARRGGNEIAAASAETIVADLDSGTGRVVLEGAGELVMAKFLPA
jgi:environmental stress-induced protein Ves